MCAFYDGREKRLIHIEAVQRYMDKWEQTIDIKGIRHAYEQMLEHKARQLGCLVSELKRDMVVPVRGFPTSQELKLQIAAEKRAALNKRKSSRDD